MSGVNTSTRPAVRDEAGADMLHASEHVRVTLRRTGPRSSLPVTSVTSAACLRPGHPRSIDRSRHMHL